MPITELFFDEYGRQNGQLTNRPNDSGNKRGGERTKRTDLHGGHGGEAEPLARAHLAETGVGEACQLLGITRRGASVLAPAEKAAARRRRRAARLVVQVGQTRALQQLFLDLVLGRNDAALDLAALVVHQPGPPQTWIRKENIAMNFQFNHKKFFGQSGGIHNLHLTQLVEPNQVQWILRQSISSFY